MIQLLKFISIFLLFISTQSCNLFNQESWELTYKSQNDFTGKTLIKIGTKSCYYEAETGIDNEVARLKWQSTPEKLQKIFKQVEIVNLQNSTPLLTSEIKPPFETLELVQNGKVIFAIQKEKQTKEISNHFKEIVIQMRTFSMEQQGWKF